MILAGAWRLASGDLDPIRYTPATRPPCSTTRAPSGP